MKDLQKEYLNELLKGTNRHFKEATYKDRRGLVKDGSLVVLYSPNSYFIEKQQETCFDVEKLIKPVKLQHYIRTNKLEQWDNMTVEIIQGIDDSTEMYVQRNMFDYFPNDVYLTCEGAKNVVFVWNSYYQDLLLGIMLPVIKKV